MSQKTQQNQTSPEQDAVKKTKRKNQQQKTHPAQALQRMDFAQGSSDILALQKTVGNQTVQRMLETSNPSTTIQRQWWKNYVKKESDDDDLLARRDALLNMRRNLQEKDEGDDDLLARRDALLNMRRNLQEKPSGQSDAATKADVSQILDKVQSENQRTRQVLRRLIGSEKE